jgi:hypothetical protein
MEKKLKDFQDASKTAPVVVEQIHCDSGGCLIASDFVAPSDEPNNHTRFAGWGPNSNPKSEKLWVWQRRRMD